MKPQEKQERNQKPNNDNLKPEPIKIDTFGLKKYTLWEYPYPPFSCGEIWFSGECVGSFDPEKIIFTEEIPFDFLFYILSFERQREVYVFYGDRGFRNLVQMLKDFFAGKILPQDLKHAIEFSKGLMNSDHWTQEAIWRDFYYVEDENKNKNIEYWKKLEILLKKLK
jgi:hypothetical protein